jgi:DNA-binding MarR family transcriptional regulator
MPRKKRVRPSSVAFETVPYAFERQEYEGQGLRYLVRAVHRGFAKVIEAELGREVPITYAQWSFLRALLQKDGLSQSELSDHVGLMENTTVAAVNVMEKRGWITRRRDPEDGRRMLVHLTAEGRKLERLRPIVQNVNRVAVRSLSRDTEDTLRKALETMLANLEQTYAQGLPQPAAKARSTRGRRRAATAPAVAAEKARRPAARRRTNGAALEASES